MSYVTNVILMTGLADGARADQIDDWLMDRDKGRLEQVDQHAGGFKSMEVNVYIGAFNYLPLEEFEAFVMGLAWEWPEEAVLVTQTEDYPPRIWAGTKEAVSL